MLGCAAIELLVERYPLGTISALNEMSHLDIPVNIRVAITMMDEVLINDM